MSTRPARSLLRDRAGGGAPVSPLELFFDLVYVFAITQLSSFFHHNLTLAGFAQGMALFLAVWWAWMYTTWAANWADPERLPVRLLLIAVMLLSLVMAIALPDAFGKAGLLFALSYVVLQVGRTVAMSAIFAHERNPGARNMARIALWFVASAAPWIAGALAAPEHRLAWWSAALAIEYLGPLAFFFVPGLGRSSSDEWDISGAHMAERGGTFIIIALGEGIVVIGARVAQEGFADGLALAFLIAFAGSVLMWWLYFDIGARRGSELIEKDDQPGRIARAIYTYLHMPIVAGVVIAAVADALLLEHWREPAGPALIAMGNGGMALYLAGIGLFKKHSSARGNFPLSHFVGLALIGALTLAAALAQMSALAFAALGVGALAVAAAWEWRSYHASGA